MTNPLSAEEIAETLSRMAETDYVRGMVMVDNSKWGSSDATTNVAEALEQSAALILSQKAEIDGNEDKGK